MCLLLWHTSVNKNVGRTYKKSQETFLNELSMELIELRLRECLQISSLQTSLRMKISEILRVNVPQKKEI